MNVADTSTTTRRHEILTGLVLLGLTFGVFLVGEFGLRLTQKAKFGVETSVEASSAFFFDEKTGIRLIKPDRQLGRVRINNLGFRGPDISAQKPSEVIRIMFLGSSTTYDANVREEANWPHKTTNYLINAFPNCQFDFINAGQPGFGTANILKLYNSRLRHLDPDVVILLPGDINQDLSWLAIEQGLDTTHYKPSTFARFSVLWAKLEKNLRIIKLQRSAFNRAGKVHFDKELVQERFRERLKQLTDTVLADNVAVFVAEIGSQLRSGQEPETQIRTGNTSLFYMPYVALGDIIAAREAYNEVIGELNTYNGVNVLHSSMAPPADRNHYIDTMHFTTLGSAIMAEATFRELVTLPQFLQRIEERGCLQQ